MGDLGDFKPLSPEEFEARRAQQRAESERLAGLWAKADAMTPEEKATRRERQVVADEEAKRRRQEARERVTNEHADCILRERLPLFPVMRKLRPNVHDDDLLDVLIYYNARKQPEWTRARELAKDTLLREDIIERSSEPLTVCDAALLSAMLMDKWSWRFTDHDPLDEHEAARRLAALDVEFIPPSEDPWIIITAEFKERLAEAQKHRAEALAAQEKNDA